MLKLGFYRVIGPLKFPDIANVEFVPMSGTNEKRLKNTYFLTQGCIEQGKTFVKDNLYLVGGVGVGIAVVQVRVTLPSFQFSVPKKWQIISNTAF